LFFTEYGTPYWYIFYIYLYLRFRNNLPGPDFVRSFLARHKELTVRTANMIKRSRAALSRDEANTFFDNFERTAAGIPAENIFNADETNLREDPGAVKAMFQRGVKYAEQVRDHGKSCISIMFCGSASGTLLPPYVVVVYEGEWFLCEVCKDQTGVPENYTKLSYTVIKGKNSFAWGNKADLHITLNEDILLINVVPEPVNNRGHLGLNSNDLKKALAKMVMAFSYLLKLDIIFSNFVFKNFKSNFVIHF
jgi:hypothetical protein